MHDGKIMKNILLDICYYYLINIKLKYQDFNLHIVKMHIACNLSCHILTKIEIII